MGFNQTMHAWGAFSEDQGIPSNHMFTDKILTSFTSVQIRIIETHTGNILSNIAQIFHPWEKRAITDNKPKWTLLFRINNRHTIAVRHGKNKVTYRIIFLDCVYINFCSIRDSYNICLHLECNVCTFTRLLVSN